MHVFVTGGSGHGHRDDKAYELDIEPGIYSVQIRYDRGGSRKPGAKNWFINRPNGERFSTLDEAMDFAEKWNAARSNQNV